MKKLTKIVLLSIILVLSLVLATACETLENHDHAPATQWTSDGTNHWHACTFEGCTEQLDKTACSGGTATLTEKATCSVCGNEYGQVLQPTVDNHDHAPATQWTSDGTNHWHACTFEGCTEQLDKTACSGGTATITEKATCSVCGNEYGDLVQPTLDNHIHEPANWVAENGNHYKPCTFVGCDQKFEQGTCSGGIPTSHNQPTCVACGNKYGQANGYGDHDLQQTYEHITIAQACELARQAGEAGTTTEYTIIGTIVTVSNSTYGEMTVADETGELYIYGAMSIDGTYYDSMTVRPVKGDIVVLKGVLKTYDGTPQMATKDNKADIVDFEHVEIQIDPSTQLVQSLKLVKLKQVQRQSLQVLLLLSHTQTVLNQVV